MAVSEIKDKVSGHRSWNFVFVVKAPGGRARTPVAPSKDLFQIFLLDNSSMMQFVSGDDVG
jgi:hypothetical protein